MIKDVHYADNSDNPYKVDQQMIREHVSTTNHTPYTETRDKSAKGENGSVVNIFDILEPPLQRTCIKHLLFHLKQ
jgi:hypothetical protein